MRSLIISLIIILKNKVHQLPCKPREHDERDSDNGHSWSTLYSIAELATAGNLVRVVHKEWQTRSEANPHRR